MDERSEKLLLDALAAAEAVAAFTQGSTSSATAPIRGFRNVLAHGYDVIDDAITWDIVVSKLPGLMVAMRRLLPPAA